VTHRILRGSGHLIPYEAPAALAAEIVSRLEGDPGWLSISQP
jgi:hypothetical protein